MKKVLVLMMVAALATAAQAAVIFEENFDSFAPFDPSANPVNIWDDNTGGGTTEKWLTGGAAGIDGSGQLLLRTGGSGQSRGLAYVLDPTQTAGMVAGDYTVSIDVIDSHNGNTFEFFAYEGVRDDTGIVNTYQLDLLSGLNGDLTHTTLGLDGDISNVLGSDTWSSGVGVSGALTLNFAYDGTDDIVIVMNSRNAADNWQERTILDDLSVEVVPEPATMVLLGLGALVGLKRRK